MKQKTAIMYSNGIDNFHGQKAIPVNSYPANIKHNSDGTPAAPTTIGILVGKKYICYACHKAFSSVRNLQKHRIICKDAQNTVSTAEMRATNNAATDAVNQQPQVWLKSLLFEFYLVEICDIKLY